MPLSTMVVVVVVGLASTTVHFSVVAASLKKKSAAIAVSATVVAANASTPIIRNFFKVSSSGFFMMPSATHDETGCSNFPHCKSARMMSNPTERLPFLPVARGTFWGSVITTVMGMPLGRYFAVIGSVLLALLFLADRYLPQPAATPHRAHVDRTVIRLQSDHRWPERIVIDTSLPTIVPPPARVADTLPARSP